jgi:peptidoglycan/LPS O-acetylase OafA/YrhL
MTRGRPLADIIASGRQNNFQLLRLIAAVMVMETHSHILLYDKTRDTHNSVYFHIGYLGLPSFFFLSGLLVTQSLHHSASWRHFLWKRILRIYPAACFSILAAALLMGPIVTTLPLDAYFRSLVFFKFLTTCSLLHMDLLLPEVFTHSVLGTSSVNASLWTVALELKLYLAILLTRPIPVPWIKRWLPPFIIAAIVLYSWKAAAFHISYVYFAYVVHFLTGMLCYYYRERIIISPLFFLLLIPSLIFLSLRLDIYRYTVFLLIPMLVMSAGAFAVDQVKKITPRPDLSYGIYVFAFPVQQLVANYLHPAGALEFFILSLIAVCPLALLSWYGVEKKALRLKDRIQ